MTISQVAGICHLDCYWIRTCYTTWVRNGYIYVSEVGFFQLYCIFNNDIFCALSIVKMKGEVIVS